MTNESGLLFDKENEDYIQHPLGYYTKRDKQENDIDSVLKERGEQYGDFVDVALLSQQLKSYLCDLKMSPLAEPYMIEALDNIFQKIARIINRNGNPAHIDSWRDIAGYAMLVVKELEKGDCDE